MTKECKKCGKEFAKERRISMKVWLTTNEFCSRTCLYSWRRGNPEFKNKLNLSGLAIGHQKGNTHGFVAGFTPWNVGISPSEETVTKIREARARQTNAIVFQSGSLHPNWKGGITEVSKAIRNLDRYLQWKIDVFIRDNRTCVKCFSTENIEADHIIPLSTLISIFEIKTAEEARMVDDLWDIANGRTLCHDCHTKTETYGGRSKNHLHMSNYSLI